jgi:NAD(P)-dependent dehydrogenase (short-subunit alcohol dehydrogenase family)
MVPIDLSGRAALVTGGSEGIGKGIALELARAGAQVLICARRPEVLEAAREEIATAVPGASVVAYAVDVGEPSAGAACVAQAIKSFGSLEILVNNAPSGLNARLMDVDPKAMEKVFRLSQVALVTYCQSAWRAWMAEHGGSIVNVTAVAADRVERGLGTYGANKAGVGRLTRQLAAELGPGVRVNAVSPGWVWSASTRRTFEEHGEKLAEALPLRRLGRPADVAGAVLYLVSDLAAWVSGQIITVDGGSLSAQGLFTRVVGE